ncbi:GntR family transcriptional regulator [Azospirillum sp.]|uniref:GntR family transcriptional regulator n=1 Tax=Azospirillum sp. TaxID=34012 RepID=UPI002D41E0C7|nr:FCD domain-containing protein [Azospirillum sp.]HYD69088.1 FCD domain-containing protein [Azospirillum sp.]
MSVDLLAPTIADRAYHRIRSDIIFDRLGPGAKLRLDRLAADYGTSVSTLREVLSRLSSEGLVHAEGQRGFEVAPVSPDGFRDVAAMRILLETSALPLSFAAGDLEWESRVVAAHHKLKVLERRMLAGDREGTELWKRYDREFHQTLIEACGSQTLLDIHAGVYDQYLRYQMVAVVFRGAAAADEHQELLDCALARDAARASAVVSRHVDACVTHALEGGALRGAPQRGQPPSRADLDTPSDQPFPSVGEGAYRKIRADIVFGRLPPGRKLKLETMKADYGVGVSTLREILNRLSSERLVVAEGQRGFEVAPVSIANLREIADLRLLLECHALEQSFRAGDMDWESRVVAAHHRLARMEERMAADDRSCTERWKQFDWQFHQALISACGSRMLIDAHAAVFDKYLRYQMIALSYRGDIASGEHALLLDCAMDRDAGRACDVLRCHVAGGLEHALATGTIT